MATPPSNGFTVTARTILELGAELISSDSIALYELIKNAYDAGSKRVVVQVTNVFRHSSLRNQLARIETARASLNAQPDPDPLADDPPDGEELLAKLKAEVLGLVDATAAEDARSRFVAGIGDPQTLEGLAASLDRAYREANLLEIIDTGEGMSLAMLRDVFSRSGPGPGWRAAASATT